jgi:hypothetical protein
MFLECLGEASGQHQVGTPEMPHSWQPVQPNRLGPAHGNDLAE